MAAHVTQKANDKQQVKPLIEQMKTNLGEAKPREVSADAGYFKTEIPWENAELSMRQGTVTARKGKQTAECPRSNLEREVIDDLIRHKTLRAEVTVLKTSSGEYRLVQIKARRVPAR